MVRFRALSIGPTFARRGNIEGKVVAPQLLPVLSGVGKVVSQRLPTSRPYWSRMGAKDGGVSP